MVSVENRDIWQRLAPWWDQHMGEVGDEFHREVVRPAVLELLAPTPGQRVLEIGCGNGGFARQLAGLGADVVATDQADAFIEAARAAEGPQVDYRVVDATDPAQLADLGAEGYDAAVANMVLMDMPVLEPLYRALAGLLRPGGRFVFAVIHPCFGYGVQPTPDAGRAGDAGPRSFVRAWNVGERLSKLIPWSLRRRLVERVGAMTSGMASLRYLEARQMRASASPDQPVAHWHFHRPLQDLLNPAFAAGLVLDGMAEPRFWNRESAQTGLLVVRLRRPGTTGA